jgi:hypothetical protein
VTVRVRTPCGQHHRISLLWAAARLGAWAARSRAGGAEDGQPHAAGQQSLAAPLPRRGGQGARTALREEGRRPGLVGLGHHVGAQRRLRRPKRMRVTLADRAGVWLDSKLDLKPSTWRCCETSLRVHFLPVWAEPPRVQWNRDSAGLSPVTPAIEGEQASSRTRPARCRRRALCRRQ